MRRLETPSLEFDVGIHDFWLFVAAGLLLNVTPGPDMALVIARSVRHGAPAGMAAAIGIGAGSLVHIIAAAMGVSALLLASASAFTLLKWAGAIYLVYLGVSLLLSSFKPAQEQAPLGVREAATFRACFAQGFLTNVLNPKVAIFFLALVPQFIDQTAPMKAAAFVVLGLTFNLTGTTWNLLVAMAAGRMGRSPTIGGVKRWFERVTGCLLAGVGVRLALAER